MREAYFIQKNREKWSEIEAMLAPKSKLSAGKLTSIYLTLTEDLSFAETFYPRSETYVYLNSLAAQAHTKIYKNKKEGKNKFIQFYAYEFPKEFRKHHRELLIAFGVFLLFTIIGAFSSAVDPDFSRLILGDAYVNKTLENIDQGDPMAIYKDANQTDMFLGITVNNIKVGLLSFTLGIFFGLGTLMIAMQNAIMLGSFQYFFYQQGLLWESARTIWIHGTIEISVIIICICSGLVIGKSMLFPGTYTRFQSFVDGIKSALKIVISTIPFFIIAGALEGYVTRYTEMPDWFAIFIITASLALILFYYVYLPIKLNKTEPETND
jgi:uncharacterized membrane protein SpoIIM required for sporulation